MAIGTTAAILGSAVLGAGASAYSGSKAAKAQKKAAGQSAVVERYIYDTTREDNAPWRDAGRGALDRLATMYGIGDNVDWEGYAKADEAAMNDWRKNWSGGQGALGDKSLAEYGKFHYNLDGQRRDLAPFRTPGSSLYEEFYKSPDYQFRKNEAMKAVERSASARGRLNSPATQLRVAETVGNQASSEYNNYANRLATLAGVGQNANAANQQAGQQYASGMTQAITNAGNARASSYANTGNAINSTIGSLGSAYLYNKGWGSGGGGGGGLPYTPTGTLFNPGAWT